MLSWVTVLFRKQEKTMATTMKDYLQSTICAPPQPRQEVATRETINRATYDLLHKVVDRKDNTWLQLDVCPAWRETRRCEEGDLCCHAHPPQNIEILERYLIKATCIQNILLNYIQQPCGGML